MNIYYRYNCWNREISDRLINFIPAIRPDNFGHSESRDFMLIFVFSFSDTSNEFHQLTFHGLSLQQFAR